MDELSKAQHEAFCYKGSLDLLMKQFEALEENEELSPAVKWELMALNMVAARATLKVKERSDK